MTKQVALKVVGDHTMHCAGCERSITFTLGRFPNVEQVSADWKTQSILIDYSSDELDLDNMRKELDWIGYEVEVETK